jgi:hypothetical protein
LFFLSPTALFCYENIPQLAELRPLARLLQRRQSHGGATLMPLPWQLGEANLAKQTLCDQAVER